MCGHWSFPSFKPVMMQCISMEHVHCAFGCVLICGSTFSTTYLKHNRNLIAIILTIFKLMDNWMVCIVHVSLFLDQLSILHRTLQQFQNINAVKLLLSTKLHHTPVHAIRAHCIQQKNSRLSTKMLDKLLQHSIIKIHCPVLCIANCGILIARPAFHCHATIFHILLSFWTFVSRNFDLIYSWKCTWNMRHKTFIDWYMQPTSSALLDVLCQRLSGFHHNNKRMIFPTIFR